MADTVEDDLTTEHGVQVIGKWDWTTKASTNRWTRPQQGIQPRRSYIPGSATTPRDDGFGILRSRRKLRGKGDALVVRFESETGKDFQLIGWTIPFTGETNE